MSALMETGKVIGAALASYLFACMVAGLALRAGL
jgi:hypothetical protein